MLHSLRILLPLLLATLVMSSCDDEISEPPGPTVNVNTTIQELKDMHTVNGQVIEITEEMDIEAVVTADDRSGNFFRKIVIADETAAIDLILDQVEVYTIFPRGSRIFVKTQGLYITDFNGQVQLSATPNGDGIPDALFESILFTGGELTEPTPKETTIGDLTLDDLSGLVTLTDVQFVTSSTFQTFANNASDPPQSVNHVVEDCAGNSILLRTSGFSDFAGEITPGGRGTVTGIFGVFGSDRQLFMRDINDVDMSGDRCGFGGPALTSLNEDFESVNNNENIALNGWTVVATQGTRLWQGKFFMGDNNSYAQATAFGDSDNATMETWMVTPAIDFDQASQLNFDSAQAFYNHDGLSVLFSTDFEGNVNTATWDELPVTLAGSSSSDHAWIASGDIDLSAYSGDGYIAFRYIGSDGSGQTTSYRIDNLLIE